ncbi:MAG: ABC transporter ATP-binding protein [Planctomycetota bacterium]
MNSQSPLIEVSDVSVRRESTLILDKVSLSIEHGEHTAILGPNGAGKSSILKLLTRDFYPSIVSNGNSGEVKILGQHHWEVSELRRRMGIINADLDRHFQTGRTGRMTVSEAVASGYTSTRLKSFGPKIDDAISARIDEIIRFVKLSGLKLRRMETLSTGERRRALIARALVHQPEILVFDEPTSGLDLAAQHLLLEVLHQLTQETTTTVLLVTHHLNEIPPTIHRAILLNGGKVLRDGRTSDVITDEAISESFGIPIRVRRDPQGWFHARLLERD